MGKHVHEHRHYHYDKSDRSKNGKTTAWGTAGLILAICSLFFVFVPYFGLPMAIIAVIFSAVQKKHKETGVATAALVVGIIGIILNAIMLLFVFIGLAFLSALFGSVGETSVSSVGTELINDTSSGSISETNIPEETECPKVVKTPTSYGFHWGESIEGNQNLWLYADFLRQVDFSGGWTLANMPSSNEFMRDTLSCHRGSYTGENTNKLYCSGSLLYDSEIKKSNIDADGNIISTDYLDVDFVFDITGKNIQSVNDLKSLRLESISCSENSLW